MNFENEEARYGEATPQRAGQMSMWATSNPCGNSTTARPVGQGLIEGYLGHGQNAAVTLQQLVNWTGLDGRAVRRQIEAERRRYIPIVSDNQNGYYLAETKDEANRFIRSMRSRAREILTTADALERAMEAIN